MSDRFQASIACAHRSVLTDVMERAPRGGGAVTISAHEDAMLRDLAGALNYWAVQPGGCDPVAPPPIVTPPPNTAVRLHDAIPKGDYSRKLFTAEAGVVDVFPFVVPGPPYAPKGPLLYASVSEYGGQPVMRITTISRTPGDLNPTTSVKWSAVIVAPDAGDVIVTVGGQKTTATFDGRYTRTFVGTGPYTVIVDNNGEGWDSEWSGVLAACGSDESGECQCIGEPILVVR